MSLEYSRNPALKSEDRQSQSRRLTFHCDPRSADSPRLSECAIVNPLLCARMMGRAGKRSVGNGRLASSVRLSVRPSIIALGSACFPLSPTSVLVRCMKPFTLFFSPCQSVRSASVRASLSADDEMASKKRKGERARLRVSHTQSALSACLIKPNNRGKSKRPTAFGSFQSAADRAAAFVMDADALCFGAPHHRVRERTFCHLSV